MPLDSNRFHDAINSGDVQYVLDHLCQVQLGDLDIIQRNAVDANRPDMLAAVYFELLTVRDGVETVLLHAADARQRHPRRDPAVVGTPEVLHRMLDELLKHEADRVSAARACGADPAAENDGNMRQARVFALQSITLPFLPEQMRAEAAANVLHAGAESGSLCFTEDALRAVEAGLANGAVLTPAFVVQTMDFEAEGANPKIGDALRNHFDRVMLLEAPPTLSRAQRNAALARAFEQFDEQRAARKSAEALRETYSMVSDLLELPVKQFEVVRRQTAPCSFFTRTTIKGVHVEIDADSPRYATVVCDPEYPFRCIPEYEPRRFLTAVMDRIESQKGLRANTYYTECWNRDDLHEAARAGRLNLLDPARVTPESLRLTNDDGLSVVYVAALHGHIGPELAPYVGELLRDAIIFADEQTARQLLAHRDDPAWGAVAWAEAIEQARKDAIASARTLSGRADEAEMIDRWLSEKLGIRREELGVRQSEQASSLGFKR